MSDHQAEAQQTDPQDNGDLMTVNEVAVMLEISKMSVYRLIAAGLIPSIRIGRAKWLPGAAVNQFLRDIRSNPGAWSGTIPGAYSAARTEHSNPTDRRYQPSDNEIIDGYSV